MDFVTRKIEGLKKSFNYLINRKNMIQTMCLFSTNLLLTYAEEKMEMEESPIRQEVFNSVRLQIQDSIQRTDY